MAYLHGLLTSPSDASSTPTLDPALKADTTGEIIPLEALVDTGTPNHNLNFLLTVLAKNRKPKQIPT